MARPALDRSGAQTAGIAVYRAATEAEPRVCVSVAGEGQELTEFYEGAPALLRARVGRVRGGRHEAAVGASWVTLSGSLPPGSPPDGIAVLIEAARSAGARVALDARDEDLEAGVLAAPDLVKVNEHEAAGLLGEAAYAQALRPPGGVACITHGAKGLELPATASCCGPSRPSAAASRSAVGRDAGRARGRARTPALTGARPSAPRSVRRRPPRRSPGAGVLDPRRARALAAAVDVRVS